MLPISCVPHALYGEVMSSCVKDLAHWFAYAGVVCSFVGGLWGNDVKDRSRGADAGITALLPVFSWSCSLCRLLHDDILFGSNYAKRGKKFRVIQANLRTRTLLAKLYHKPLMFAGV